jgi:3-mercaptopyruvate sulfurtransferase SseA
MADYANDVLVETDWVADHLDDDDIRIVEVDENPALYAEAHIPGAIGFDWEAAGSRTTTPSCSTATATTGSPPTPTGTSATTATTRSS